MSEEVNDYRVRKQVFVTTATRYLTEQIDVADRRRECEVESPSNCGTRPLKRQVWWSAPEVGLMGSERGH